MQGCRDEGDLVHRMSRGLGTLVGSRRGERTSSQGLGLHPVCTCTHAGCRLRDVPLLALYYVFILG